MSEVTLESFLGKTEKEAKQAYIGNLVAGVKQKIIVPLIKAGISKEVILKTTQNYISQGYNSILALPSYAEEVLKVNKGEGINCGVLIGYPLGENKVESILAEIKTWAKSKVNEIVVVLPLSDLKFNKCKLSEKIVKTLVKLSKKKRVGIMINSNYLNDVELADVSKRLGDSKIDKLYVSTGFYKDPYDVRFVNAYKKVRTNAIIKYAYACASNTFEEVQQSLQNCDFVLTENANSILEEMVSKISL